MTKFIPSAVATVGASFALWVFALAFADVPSNKLVRGPEGVLTLLVTGAGAAILSVTWVWLRTTRISFYCALVVSFLLFLFSLSCLCI
jgi:hypothetical protein